MNISFWLAGSKQNRAGLAPTGVPAIFAKITITGKKPVNFSTGIKIRPDQWVPGGNGFVKGKDKLAAAYNERLVNTRAELQGIYNDLERREQVITAKKIKVLFQGADLSAIKLKKALKMYLQEREKEKLSNSYIRTLWVRHRAILRYLVSKKYQDLQLIEVNTLFLTEMEDYHKRELQFDQSTINKLLSLIKTVVAFGVTREWLDYNPVTAHKNQKLQKKQKVYLTLEEVDMIRFHKYAVHRIERVAKLFILQCFTGLAYVDLMRLDRSWVRRGENEKYWIYTDRQKVAGSDCRIPLFRPALECLGFLDWKIDRISNGNYNAYLKEVAFICGIEKNLTTHVGRKTFGNLMLDKGVSLEVVSSMYGHSNTKTTLSYYVDISERRISEETSGLKF
jgi:integrase/recombinase XerD